MALFFEWDDAKARSNEQKHGVSFSEAATVFADPLAAILPDPNHSDEEIREIIVGHSNRNRLLLVSFTERGENIRIISAESQPRANAKTTKRNRERGNHERRTSTGISVRLHAS